MTYHEPVKPESMALLFVYLCPYCQNELVLVSPTQPITVACGSCRNSFPIVPVDERTVQYVHTILGDGKAAADPNY
ncbi:MAG: hypothetical protein IKJ34_02520 [Mailhella sp.]|nr:hypothetical protein [Mailhella sp.]